MGTLVFDAVDVGMRLGSTLYVGRKLGGVVQAQMVRTRPVSVILSNCSDALNSKELI